MRMKREAIGRIVSLGLFVGCAGGLAEIAWIALYAAATHQDAARVAHGVANTVALGGQAPVGAGIAIHMSLAALLGIAIAWALRLWQARLHGIGRDAAVVSALVVVWAVNFFIVLPALNPSFVGIVPLAVSFISKVSFGIAAALCLRLADQGTVRASPAVAARWP
jgi:hypothetical protein